MHGLPGLGSCVHMWHDISTRPWRPGDLRADVTIQGYPDGAGLKTEFDHRSMIQELEDILWETLDLGRDEQNALSIWDAWERRIDEHDLRTALQAARQAVTLRVARQAVTRQAVGG